MIKIITLANLNLFLTKCKTLFAAKKHTHTASEITGLPTTSASKPTTLYGNTSDAGGLYPVFKGGSKNASLLDWMGNLLMRTRNPDSGSGIELYYGDDDTTSTKAIVVNSNKGVTILAPNNVDVLNAKNDEVSMSDAMDKNARMKLTPANASVKYSGKGLDVTSTKTSLTSTTEVLLNSEGGEGASLRLSAEDVHLDGIDGGMMLLSRKNTNGNYNYELHLPLKGNLNSTTEIPTATPITGIRLHKTWVELAGPDNSIYGENIYLGGSNDSTIDVEARSMNFYQEMDIMVDGYVVPSIFPSRTIPNFNELGLLPANVIEVPDEELTYKYMYHYAEEVCVFRNESNTMCFFKDGNRDIYQPLPFPVFASVTDVANQYDEDFVFYAYSSILNKWELNYNIQAAKFYEMVALNGLTSKSLENIQLLPNGRSPLGCVNTVNLPAAFVLLAKAAQDKGYGN